MVIFYGAVFVYFLVIYEIILRTYYLSGVHENGLAALVVQTVINIIGLCSTDGYCINNGRCFVKGSVFNFLRAGTPAGFKPAYRGKGMRAGNVFPVGKSASCSGDG